MINTGTLVTAAIRPNDSLDLIASAFANEVKGGHHGYATLAERDALITARREWGMLVTVYNDGGNNGTYQLTYNYVDTDITNDSNWTLFSGGVSGNSSTWTNSVLSMGSTPPGSPTDGDRYLIGVTASGFWYTNENKIAQYNSTLGSWVFTTPTDGYSLVINNEPNAIYRYTGSYSTGTWVKQLFGGLSNKYHIENEDIIVPVNFQYFIYGDLTIGTAGSLTNYGQVINLNGDIIIESTGTFSNYGYYYSPIIDYGKYVEGPFNMIAGGNKIINHNLNTQDIVVNIVVPGSIPTSLIPISLDYEIMDPNQVVILPPLVNINDVKIIIIK